MTAELGPFTTQRDEWAYRAQLDDEQQELLVTPPLALTTDSPNALAVGIAISVVSAMILLIGLAYMTSAGWLS